MSLPDDIAGTRPFPGIGDYGFLSDCHSTALVSRWGSVDWCCMPSLDSPSCFGRLLDWNAGGHCSISPRSEGDAEPKVSRRYLAGTLILETRFRTPSGEAGLLDAFAMRRGGRREPHRQLLRIVEGLDGEVTVCWCVAPRFDYGRSLPWLRRHGRRLHSAIGGASGLVIDCDVPLQVVDGYVLAGQATVRAGDRYRMALTYRSPHELYPGSLEAMAREELDQRLEATVEWWQSWSRRLGRPAGDPLLRSAKVLKGLIYAPTGAMAAAATSSLPESPGGDRNWDYRYSWVRDSAFAMRALGELGCTPEWEAFEKFMERATAGGANQLQVMYGLRGEHNLFEGYRGAQPVRLGNDAYLQQQHDAYGELLEMAWEAHLMGRSPDDSYWRFLVEIADDAAERWKRPDHGIWEMRREPLHLVHSKVMCWVALDRALHLAQKTGREAPVERWSAARNAVREAIEKAGYDRHRGVFVQVLEGKELDAALLLLPRVGFVPWDDPRMVRTAEAIRRHLSRDGLIYRYRSGDGLEGEEGAFLPCTFWLAECLAHQGKVEEATEVFARAAGCANDLGLFAEQHHPESGEVLGNFPQGLTHLSHITAAFALAEEAPEALEEVAGVVPAPR
jgi:GH15 family glucan-1,4-alpha-glucosidase